MNKIHVFSFASYQARYFFQQLISGVFYCHSMVINTKIFRVISVSFLCLVLTFPLIYLSWSKYAIEIWSWRTPYWMEAQLHVWRFVILVIQRFNYRFNLVWEVFLSGICEIFFLWLVLFVQSSLLHSRPKSTVGTPAYIAPEVLSRREYDGKVCCPLTSCINPCCVPHFYLFFC